MAPQPKARINVWLESGEGVALSRWRVRLLQEVERTGSINAAAAALKIPYRLAWQRLHEMEERLGLPLVVATVGGRGGGGTTLTPTAKDLIERFMAMLIEIEAYALMQFHKHFEVAITETTPGSPGAPGCARDPGRQDEATTNDIGS